MKSFLFCCVLLAAITSSGVQAFVQPAPASLILRSAEPSAKKSVGLARSSSSVLSLANRDDDDKNVNVNLIPDVDSVTLTTIGFGLIAFNFFVLGNVR